ncbi:cell wall-binding repeat-containing protein [Embleya scabrispora]|uniref:cell wall-binding repeat-containing protein n=1 Tax=Embleya scabrispora TaxID=159449 RepID=UPI00099F39B0|nr:cell wall-binding repeat-containing protein [Embleya scabrispora]MYS81389.1 cell wall-binding repeat-containing protein [Streptomyces sp. SID5474]
MTLAMCSVMTPAKATPAQPPPPMEMLYTYATDANGGYLTVAQADNDLMGWYTPIRDFYPSSASPDGSRLVGNGGSGNGYSMVRSIEVNGSAPIDIKDPHASLVDPEYSSDGTRLFMTRDPRLATQGATGLYVAPSDGSAPPTPLFSEAEAACDSHMSASRIGLYAFTRRDKDVDGNCDGEQSPRVMLYNEQTGATTSVTWTNQDGEVLPLWDRAPDISPDGTRIAISGWLDGHGAIGVHELATGKQTWTGSGYQAPIDPDWSPSGQSIAYEDYLGVAVKNFETGGGGRRGPKLSSRPVWRPRPVSPATAVRVYGENAIDTSIAASRFKYDAAASTETGARKARTAVLTRADSFYDGLAGSGLAGAKGGPMLLTPGSGMTPELSAELSRALAPGSTVYLLGGRDVLGASIETQVRSLGLVPRRLAGNAVEDTAIEIAGEMTATPEKVLVATAEEYYDALAAGAVTGTATNTTLVLTWGANLPTATAGYLNRLNRSRTKVITVGGPAQRALATAGIAVDTALTGQDATDTARLVADREFSAPASVALATTESWQDALTGGALISGYGPLLLSARAQLSSPAQEYLAAHQASLRQAVLLGGMYALALPMDDAVGRLIADGPGEYRTFHSRNGDVRVALDWRG